MKNEIIFLIMGILIGSIVTMILISNKENSKVETIFSPEEGDKILQEIRSANQSIEIEMFVFSSQEAYEELIKAKNRGVEIRVILEKRDSGGSNERMVEKLKEEGIDARFATYEYKLTHAKIIIIDGKIVIVGSHNLTKPALTENREASIILRDSIIANAFRFEFEKDFLRAWN